MKTYNKAVFMPKDKLAQVIGKSFVLEYTEHANHEASNDRYGAIQSFKRLTVTEKNVVELYLDDSLIVCKLLVRMAYNAFSEVCYIIVPQNDKALVKTCWLCSKNDRHSTLDKSLYETK